MHLHNLFSTIAFLETYRKMIHNYFFIFSRNPFSETIGFFLFIHDIYQKVTLDNGPGFNFVNLQVLMFSKNTVLKNFLALIYAIYDMIFIFSFLTFLYWLRSNFNTIQVKS